MEALVQNGLMTESLTILAQYWTAIPPENIRKPKGFPVFSGGKVMQNWAEID